MSAKWILNPYQVSVSRQAWLDRQVRDPDRSTSGIEVHTNHKWRNSLLAPPCIRDPTIPGMKHSDVFGSLYIMSPCCLAPMGGGGPVNPAFAKALEAVKTPADSAGLPFGVRAQLASAAAWAPNPKNPPLYLDLPVKDGEPQKDVIAKFTANAPLVFMDQYIGNLKQYRAISIDVGDKDGLKAGAGKLHEILDTHGIANGFEIYEGTHTSAVAVRFQNYVMPFFSKNLCASGNCK